MQAAVELPKAFSVRDDCELPLIQDLMARMNPKLLVAQVATGLHVNSGCTVNWGLAASFRKRSDSGTMIRSR
jgi:hypothetical protein